MANHSNRSEKSNFSGWIFPIIMLAVFPPVGILLLILKVLSAPKHTGGSGRHPYYIQREQRDPVGVRTTSAVTNQTPESMARQAATFAQQQSDRLKAMDSKGKRLAIIGGIVTALFGLSTATVIGSAVSDFMGGYMALFQSDISALFPMLCFTGGGVGVLWAGLRRRKQLRRFRSYMAMVGRHSSFPISELASASGRSPEKVREDLEDMLGAGLFPQGFLDYGANALVIPGNGPKKSASRKKPAGEPAKAEKAAEKPEENAVLQEIRAVNDAIDDEKLSRQIDRIGVITAKILEYQKSRPEKAAQLHSFLSYYLPTTLKILRAYAQLEDQEIRGENITAAMERIEGMMDKVVEGFEKQLDMLFQGDAMDITTDVEVLERMLAKDGLSNSDGMTMSL